MSLEEGWVSVVLVLGPILERDGAGESEEEEEEEGTVLSAVVVVSGVLSLRGGVSMP